MDTPSGLSLFQAYGIEIEYMIVDRAGLDVRPVTDEVIRAVAGEYRNEVELDGIAWSNELVLHVIELKTNGPAPSLAGLPAAFHDNIRRINAILEEHGACLMPGAMHPWMDPYRDTRLWPHEASEIYDTYNRIFDCRGHGWSNLQSMHINLPFAGDAEFAALHGAIRALLAVMPALAASSPLADGALTGLMDTRLETYRHNARIIPSITGQVIPEVVSSRREYEQEILEPMYADIAPHDPGGILQDEWLNSRGAIARFDRNAVEIRVLDTQECTTADLAVADLITRVLREMVAGRWCDAPQLAEPDTGALARIFLDTVRDAEQAVLDHKGFLALFRFPERKCTAGEFWRYLYEDVDYPRSASDPALADAIAHTLDHGSLARRIARAVGRDAPRARIAETCRVLCACLAENRPFTGI